MFDRTGNYLIYAILLSMILGVAFVGIFGDAGLHVKFLGDMFLAALKMVVIPLLFFSMVVGISNLGDVRKLGRTGAKTIGYFLATSTIAVVIGLILVNLIQPGSGFTFSGAAAPETIGHQDSYSFFTWLTDQIPSNILKAAAETKVLPVIVFALIFGGVLTTIGSKGRTVISFCDAVNDVFMKIVHLIMWFAPIGIFGLVAGQLAAEGGLSQFTSILSALGKYSAVVIIGLLIHGIFILPLALKFMAGKSPIEYFVGMSQALMTAFATASSSATLPVTMDCVAEKNDIDKRASSFVLPLGATINMDGTALYEAVAALFIAQAYGISLGIVGQITICLTAVLASIGAAGIPQAGLITMVLVLQAVGLPLEGIGLILSIDWFLDRCRTTVNVWGDSIGAAVIATTAEIGLVDRRRRKPEKSTWMKSTARRKDTPRKRQKPDSTRKVKGKPISTVSKRSSVPDKTATKPAEKRGRKSSRVAQKPIKRIHKVDSSPLKGGREEYGPQDIRKSISGDEPIKKKPIRGSEKSRKTGSSKSLVEPKVEPTAKAKPRVSKSNGEAREKSADDKPIFGRRQKSSPVKKKPDSKFENDDSALKKSEPISNSGNTFDVPKFPSSILDDLKVPDLSGDHGEEEKATEDAHNLGNFDLESKPMEISSDATIEETSPSVETESESIPESSKKEFERLDRAVLGNDTAEKSDSSNDSDSHEVQQESSDNGDMISMSDNDPSLPEADRPIETEMPDTPGKIVSEVSPMESDSQESVDDVTTSEDKITVKLSEISDAPPEPVEESLPEDSRIDSTSEDIAPLKDEDTEEPLEWGRTKRKRNRK
ncbi:MAG: cation:dicarboxylase symporter family transporter [candidate division Zixibacteria bacterium]